MWQTQIIDIEEFFPHYSLWARDLGPGRTYGRRTWSEALENIHANTHSCFAGYTLRRADKSVNIGWSGNASSGFLTQTARPCGGPPTRHVAFEGYDPYAPRSASHLHSTAAVREFVG